jgi:hypothetical protein
MVLKRSTLSSSASSSAVGNDFIVSTGTSGNTTVTLSKDFAAGSYVVVSALSDTAYDIYLVASDGTSAGSVNSTTASTTIDASKAFNTVVIYGAQNNDTFTFTFKYVFSPSADNTSIVAAGPRVTSVGTNVLPNVDSSTTITGKNFASNATVTFTGTDNVVRNAKSVTRNSSTSLTVVRPDDLPNAYQPYTITVLNPGISAPTSTNLHKLGSLSGGSVPTWSTSVGELSTIMTKGSAYSHSLEASDPDTGGSVTYSVASGSLPSGLSLNSSTGVISGTSSDNFGTYSITVRATDAGGNYVDRAFTLANFISSDTDSFDRSTSGNLGNTSNKATVWTNQRGTWQADGSRAYSNDSAGTHAVATIVGSTTNISNLQVDTQNTGGVGVAFWVSDANNYYAATTYYSTSTASSTSCSGGGSGLTGGGYSGACCSGFSETQRYEVDITCNDGSGPYTYLRTGCTTTSTQKNNLCGGSGGGYDSDCRGPYTYYSCTTTNVSTTTTNYLSKFRIINNGSAIVDTQYGSSTGGYSTAGSIAISTSGNTISYSAYSGANKSGLIHSGSTTPSNPVKGRNVGVYKGDGGSSQGSYVDNFNVTLS